MESRKPTDYDIDYYAVFKQTSSPYLILAPNPPDYTIMDANNARLEVTMTTKDVIGSHCSRLFQIIPKRRGLPG